MAHLVVGLTPALAAALSHGERTTDTSRLGRFTRRAGIDLRPQRERALDDDAGTVWYWADTGASTPADELTAALLALPGITAAYVKPEDAAP